MDGGEAHSERLWTQLAVIVAVAASHMSMPNHWLPYSMVARAHSWTLRKALFLSKSTAAILHPESCNAGVYKALY